MATIQEPTVVCSGESQVSEGRRTEEAGTSQDWYRGGVETVNLNKESERLKTFKNWPVEFLQTSRMAKAGFYYNKRGDSVRCAFCGIGISNWKPGDDPLTDHAKYSPSCSFVTKGPAAAGDIPLSQEQTPSSPAGVDTCGPFMFSETTPSSLPNDPELLETLNYQKLKPPRFPEYGTYDSRLRSYATWPISLKLDPHVLSEAGLFYTGRGDQTLCYHCGFGLKEWEETDDPWVEHARWFPKCTHVLTLKGKSFIDEVSGKKAEEDLKGAQTNRQSRASGDITRLAASLKSPNRDPEEESSSGVLTGSSQGSGADAVLCKICYSKEVGVALLPCRHIVSCTMCALSLSTCAICRKPVTATFRVYLS